MTGFLASILETLAITLGRCHPERQGAIVSDMEGQSQYPANGLSFGASCPHRRLELVSRKLQNSLAGFAFCGVPVRLAARRASAEPESPAGPAVSRLCPALGFRWSGFSPAQGFAIIWSTACFPLRYRSGSPVVGSPGQQGASSGVSVYVKHIAAAAGRAVPAA